MGLEAEWTLSRLVKMLDNTLAKDTEIWKESPLQLYNNQYDITSDERDATVTWIAKLTFQFRFYPETFFLATNILDRFLITVKAKPKYLRCIALSCFYLASKISEEEDVIPCTEELVKESKCGCQVPDVLRMERIILNKLSWQLISATSLDYLHVFQTLTFRHFTDLSSSVSLPYFMGMMTNSLIRVLCDYELAIFPNAAISLALFSLNLEAMTQDPVKWTTITGKLQTLAKVKTHDLMKCRNLLMSNLSWKEFARLVEKAPVSVQSFISMSSSPGASSSENLISGGSSGAVKCKAASISTFTAMEATKKIHTNGVDPMEVVAEDSDITLTASEGEVSEEEPEEAPPAKQPTYAEIVKNGLRYGAEEMEHQDTDLSTISATEFHLSGMSNPCSMQASYGFGTPLLTQGHIQQQRIRT